MNDKTLNILACIAQFLLCTGGGFWVGYLAEPDSVGTSGIGALAMGVALLLSYGAAQTLGIGLGSLQFVRQRLQRAAGQGADHAARVDRDDRLLRTVMGWVAGAAMVSLSVIAAIVIWIVSSGGDFSDTLWRCLLIGVVATLLMTPAMRVVHA